MQSNWKEYRHRIISGVLTSVITITAVSLFLHELPHSKVKAYSNLETEIAMQTNTLFQTKPPTDRYAEVLDIAYGTATGNLTLAKLSNTASSVHSKELLRRASIAIPSMHVLTAVYEGTTDKTLSLGVGTAKKEQNLGEGNFTVVGHNLSGIDGLEKSGLSGIQPFVATENLANEGYRKTLVMNWLEPHYGEYVYARNEDKVYTYQIKYGEVLPKDSSYVANDNRVKVFDSVRKVPLLTSVLPVIQEDGNSEYIIVLTASFVRANDVTADSMKPFKGGVY